MDIQMPEMVILRQHASTGPGKWKAGRRCTCPSLPSAHLLHHDRKAALEVGMDVFAPNCFPANGGATRHFTADFSVRMSGMNISVKIDDEFM